MNIRSQFVPELLTNKQTNAEYHNNLSVGGDDMDDYNMKSNKRLDYNTVYSYEIINIRHDSSRRR